MLRAGQHGDRGGDHRVHAASTSRTSSARRRSSFVESLPRTATGKLQKFVIREQYWQGVERRVG